MIDIQLVDNLGQPRIAVCHGGNIRLYMSPESDVSEALELCRTELLTQLEERFRKLFGARDFPRIFVQRDSSVVISPNPSQVGPSETYFAGFLGD